MKNKAFIYSMKCQKKKKTLIALRLLYLHFSYRKKLADSVWYVPTRHVHFLKRLIGPCFDVGVSCGSAVKAHLEVVAQDKGNASLIFAERHNFLNKTFDCQAGRYQFHCLRRKE